MSAQIVVKPAREISGKVKLPGDKSISHRAIFLGSLARGLTEIDNLSAGDDCQRSIKAFQNLGIPIKNPGGGDSLEINGRGLSGLEESNQILDLGNSGTTVRLLLGVLAGQNFCSVLTGDQSLQKRPMGRVTAPLEMMGAKIVGREKGNLLPLVIKGGKISAIDYRSPVASAQVKSAILLAGLYAEGETRVEEPAKSRDHTERMLPFFGAEVKDEGRRIDLKGRPDLKGKKISVPGDISVAAFFLAAAGLIPSSSLKIEEVGLNPTRLGIIEALQRMGMNLEVEIISEDFEPRGNITVKSSKLKGITLQGEIIPRLIDEIPILLVAATQAEGRTVFEGIGELRLKETDRIHSMVTNLRKMGASLEEEKERLVVIGPRPLKGAMVESFGDHRTAMSMIVAGLIARGKTTVLNTGCIRTSTPSFWKKLSGLVVF
ncbi:MAG: 3-phosphoshikimate 1-carboxyvinyltransferase [Candidatus Ratteibacteria bacterium]|nr:3-phosphoshikimate 1-carboxyvinyltransferase [Candidatus Ratteibacteria bacterium]